MRTILRPIRCADEQVSRKEDRPVVQRIQIVVEDDLTGGRADETVFFALDGQRYEIDLAEANAESLRQSLAPFMARARRVRGRLPKSGPHRPVQATISAADAQEIRAWARATGRKVSARGRLPQWLIQAYNGRAA
ncbi:Lsr2 family protein [Kitasatospora sp. NPDC088160]|uniref:histone-like nucleoid-structuring protein Lsr2 n=1 Tax=Kitasatospora sp. NPDC088160 TaxID=3364072 RepID=UPI0038287D1C